MYTDSTTVLTFKRFFGQREKKIKKKINMEKERSAVSKMCAVQSHPISGTLEFFTKYLYRHQNYEKLLHEVCFIQALLNLNKGF